MSGKVRDLGRDIREATAQRLLERAHVGGHMATFQNTVTIRRAVEDVFTFLADFENIPKWNYAIVETKKTSPGAVGVGTTYRQIRSIPDRSEEGFKVTAFDIGPFIATISYLLTPIGDETRLTNAVDLKPSSAVLRLFAPLAVSRVKASVAANLERLKQVLETGRPSNGKR
jgi:Polyketide cyclase / dehydrase and lipid transport